MVRALKKYADFEGRASRSEFWDFTLPILGIFTISMISFSTVGLGVMGKVIEVIFLVSIVVFIVPTFSVAIRRLHDMGHSGWWFLAIFGIGGILGEILGGILEETLGLGWDLQNSLISWLVIWAVLCWPGTKGDNRYGPDPLAPAVSPPSLPEQPAAEN